MIKVDFVYTDKNGEYNDSAKVESLATAEKELVELIGYFNATEKGRYGDKAVLRKFVRIVESKKSALKKRMDNAYDNLVAGPASQDKPDCHECHHYDKTKKKTHECYTEENCPAFGKKI